ncbi:transglutaminase superfamily protein [Mucilaginibacter gracilis]|uniref:Transglutaminase superfamily protein n=1 Tax=Mucilaginibacter gracilis TaxID=423350 RepID=A0A495J029_9SPHI|nr:DUF3857 and transglutaminase domain-containing protein [Mucilaginibacter gracilis]RKR82287.1 transglutaminase superfamily protein [Mucilaginibacter gracilis]
MKKQSLLLFTALLCWQNLYSQAIEKETWEAKPVIHTVGTKYGKESAVIIMDKRQIEYIDEKEEVAEYYTLHKIIHINDDRGIENFNKIYLGVSEKSDIVDVRARTITPDGKIIELNKNNIKDIKEEDGNTYKIFALDGLSKGCEVEYFYTVKRPTTYFGREVIQSVFPILASSVQLIKPERLKFEIKPYNCPASPVDTLIGTKKITRCDFTGIPGAEEEKYAFYDNNLWRVEFKLSYNDAKQKGERLFTWNELARRIFSVYTYYSEKDVKKVQDLVKANAWDGLGDEVKKIIAVENYIKKNYSYNDDLKSDEGNSLESVIKNKIGGTIGSVRLYSAIFQNLGIRYQFVLTGDRNKFMIDRTFENWNNCDYPLFYFPAENKFIAPTRPDYRYPLIYPYWGDTNGLFCKSTSIGTFSTAIADIRPIELEDYKKSCSNIESKLELNNNLDSITVDAKQIYDGYPAVDYRDAFNFSNEDQKKTMIKEMAKMVSSTDHILFSEALNSAFEATDQPFIMHTKTKSAELIEHAGNKLLLKIGLAIGPQVEMYQEKPRQQPVDIEYGHVEKRKIEFTIPAGYTISNPNDLKIDETFKDNGELTMGFVSNYEIKGNLLTVNITEEYRKTLYPLSQFPQFRKIINASSDFNKVVLVLQKM